MLNQKYFYHGLFKAYIAIFGTLFNEIDIYRTEEDGDVTHKIRVPLTYSNKDKMLTRLAADPAIDRPAAITLPRISFEMTHPWYDADRRIQDTNFIVEKDPDDANKVRILYSAVPYSLDFSLYVYAKNAEDATKIVEQIIPSFNPVFTVSAILVPELNIKRDIPITLNNINITDTYEDKFTERRAIVWELNFTMKAYFFGPVLKKPIIKYVDTNVIIEYGDLCAAKTANLEPDSTLRIQPGLTANGTPTSNVAESIPVSSIFLDDNWGIVSIKSNGDLFGDPDDV